MLHITQLDEADLSGIMDSLFAAIEEGQWLDAFPDPQPAFDRKT